MNKDKELQEELKTYCTKTADGHHIAGLKLDAFALHNDRPSVELGEIEPHTDDCVNGAAHGDWIHAPEKIEKVCGCKLTKLTHSKILVEFE